QRRELSSPLTALYFIIMHKKISFANNFGIWIRKEEGRRIDYYPKVNILTKMEDLIFSGKRIGLVIC
ncbi:hypothetical protein KAT45_03600, partial [Candidatus Aerophobetes bacterium]|nr:hypothetical protein [Candidatus Aerophobetes bacterium]